MLESYVPTENEGVGCVCFYSRRLRGLFGGWSRVGAAFAGEEAMSAPNWRDHQLEISNGGEAHRLAATHEWGSSLRCSRPEGHGWGSRGAP